MNTQPAERPERLACETVHARESLILAPYAMHSARSAGRRYREPEHPYRSPFARDRDRIVHSAAFRRLSGKTQVFTGNLGDYHRTRLTHTMEVASIARTIGRTLRLNEDLIEALALAHDVGHPPFGHAGEDILDGCLHGKGGFNHNRQALRVFELLETRYAAFPGLNLSLEVLQSQAARAHKEAPRHPPLLEAQVVDAADSVAYTTHDADDALELGLLELEEMLQWPMWNEAAGRVRRRCSGLTRAQLRRAVVHQLIDWQVGDLVDTGRQRLAPYVETAAGSQTQQNVRLAPSTDVAEQKAALENLLYQRVYRHPSVLAVRQRAQSALRAMYQALLAEPDRLPAKFRGRAAEDGSARAVSDYLAGMTDRFAVRAFVHRFPEHARDWPGETGVIE